MNLDLSVAVDRSSLGMLDLEVNDGENYICTPTLEPGELTWRRNQVESPFVDGSFTVSRAKEAMEARIVVDVVAESHSVLQGLVSDLIEAFTQDEFDVTITIDGAVYTWRCETADYAMGWEHERMHNKRVRVGFQMFRDPNPVAGPF